MSEMSEKGSKPTFICKDCGDNVFDALGEVGECCQLCQWLRDIADPDDRAKLRVLLRPTIYDEANDPRLEPGYAPPPKLSSLKSKPKR
jgi:hypothetical protein